MQPTSRGWAIAAMLLSLGGLGCFLGAEEPSAFVALDEPAPALAVARGSERLPSPVGPHAVHFWATWCAPCEAELPALMAAAEAEGVTLLAVTDEPWPDVERYFRGEIPPAVVRDVSGAAYQSWRVAGLPATLAVRGGRVVSRRDGPGDWHDAEARAWLRALKAAP